MRNEYVAVIAYAAVPFLVIVGGLIWQRYRKSIGRRLGLKHYHESGTITQQH
jgi:hypothetical protein